MRKKLIGNSTVLVLGALASGSKYGFDIMDRTGLQSGTVYRALSRLEELGFATSHWESAEVAIREKRPRRRYYRVTAVGRRELQAAQARLADFVHQLASERR